MFLTALLCSAFFSGAETAIISARRIQLEVWVRRGVRGARKAHEFLHYPERFLTTTLVGTNIANVAASSLMAFYLERYLSGFAITAVSVLVLLFFGESLPKSIARERATSFTLRASFFLRFFYRVLYPLIWTVMKLSQWLLKILGLEGGSVKRFFTREDLDLLVQEGERAGIVNAEERRLISRFIIRGNEKARDVMIPRTEMAVVKMDEAMGKVSRVFEKTGYSRLPVMGKSIDEIVGMVTVRDFLLEKPDRIKRILRSVLFVPESRNIASLLREMQKKRMGLAIVVDEYGGTSGLVTLEDIVEEYFGEIFDEADVEENLYRKIGPRQIDVKARVQIEEMNRRFGLHLPEGEYQTLGGLLMERLGHIPKRGEKVDLSDCTIVVLSVFKKRVEWVRILRTGNDETR